MLRAHRSSRRLPTGGWGANGGHAADALIAALCKASDDMKQHAEKRQPKEFEPVAPPAERTTHTPTHREGG
eukprot:COSAG01_NODE_26811_length_702_cov_1.859038_1_plen_70_part_01